VLKVSDAQRGDAVLVALAPDAQLRETAIVSAVETYLSAQGLSARGAIRTQLVESLPRTATGKLQRKAIVVQDRAPPAIEGLAAQIRASLGLEALRGTTTTYHDMGGDSLAHMQMTMALERAFGTVPSQWETTPLADLVARAEITPPPEEITGAPPLPTGTENMNPKDLGFWQLVREDFRTNDASLAHQGFWMLFVHRFGNWRMDVRPRLLRAPLTLLYRVLNKLTQILFGMKLDYTVKVGRRVKLEHFGGMILGAREIGDDVVLRQNTTLGIRSVADLRAKPILGNRVDVGAGAVIVGNIHIGDNSIIGANSVVFSNVPEGSVIMGVPGRIIGQNPRRNPSPLPGYDET
jgi:serine O-acetyltransferase